MATQEGLIRSFYTWLRKAEHALLGNRNHILTRLPKTRPTLLSEITPVSASVCAALTGTELEERAIYWRNLFESIQTKGWVEGQKLVGSNNQEEQG